jgi:hypothetical protein
VERYDCEKFAEDAIYLCEEMRRLRDRLCANTSIPQIDISIFESLEQCAQFTLGEIAQREDNVIAKRRTVFKEAITKEQAEERRGHMHHHHRAQTGALLDIITKVKESDMQISEKAGEALSAQDKLLYRDAFDHQQLLKLEGVIESQTVALVDAMEKATDDGRKHQRREDNEPD